MNSKKLKTNTYQLRIGWLYPDLMSTYGDRGNIIDLQKRCAWRGIKVTIEEISIGDSPQQLALCSLLIMGGAEDRQQKLVAADFQKGKDAVLSNLIEKNTPGLFICGAYQFLGKQYNEADGTVIKGLGILDVHTKNPGQDKKRLIGNIAVDVEPQTLNIPYTISPLIGFENHGGRTYLGKNVQPLGKVKTGFGNNGEDGTEGAVYKNSIGTYLHGPILPKNPQLADWLIAKSLEIKYGKEIELEPLEDTLEYEARNVIAHKLHIEI